MTNAKQKAKERDEWECRFCGTENEEHKKETGRNLHAHHIVKKSSGGKDDPSNLITVCESCHNTLESTQADALARIKSSNDNSEEIEKLKFRLHKKEETIMDMLDTFDYLVENGRLLFKVYVVYDDNHYSDKIVEYVGASEEEALQSFKENTNNGRIQEHTITVDDWIDKFSDSVLNEIHAQSILSGRIMDIICYNGDGRCNGIDGVQND